MAFGKSISLVGAFLIIGAANAGTITFEDLALAPESYWNGSDESGGFTSGGAWFNNNYNTSYDSWDGFAYSNITDTVTQGLDGQYNSIVGSGRSGSANYAVGYVGWMEPPTITLAAPATLGGLYVTNNNYTYYSMLNGDAIAKKFGGATGNDPDWFLMSITGKDADGSVTAVVDSYLADYRFENNSLDYIVDDWQYVDLTSLGAVKCLEFTLSSSDVGGYGMNTPAYFAMDNLVIPEPTSIAFFVAIGLLLIKRQCEPRVKPGTK